MFSSWCLVKKKRKEEDSKGPFKSQTRWTCSSTLITPSSHLFSYPDDTYQLLIWTNLTPMKWGGGFLAAQRCWTTKYTCHTFSHIYFPMLLTLTHVNYDLNKLEWSWRMSSSIWLKQKQSAVGESVSLCHLLMEILCTFEKYFNGFKAFKRLSFVPKNFKASKGHIKWVGNRQHNRQ